MSALAGGLGITRTERLIKLLILIWSVMFVLGAVFFLGRLGILDLALSTSIDTPVIPEVLMSLWTGARFDLRTSTVLLLPVFLIGIVSGVFRTRGRLFPGKVYAAYFSFLTTIAAFASIVSYYYVITYGNNIDVFAFSIVRGAATDVLTNIVEDYPVMISSFVLIAVAYASFRLYSRIIFRVSSLELRLNRLLSASVLTLLILSYLVAARGSIGTFPLREMHALISSHPIVNASVPNGLISTWWAYDNYAKSVQLKPVTLEDGKVLFKEFYQSGEEQFSFHNLFAKTAENSFLKENPPDVVFTMMESLSTHLNGLHREGSLNTLGSLADHLNDGFIFKRFLSDDNSTIGSLVRMFVSSPMETISLSPAQNVPFSTSAAKIYKDAGYKTVFITAGHGNWENLSTFLKYQSFDEVVGEAEILARYPEAQKQSTWGVFDEYAFRYAKEILDSSDKPVFIAILTISNHPPYELPATYQPHPVNMSAEIVKRFEHSPAIQGALETTQYSNDALGDFVASIKKGAKSDKTVIAVTGDHNARAVVYSDLSEIALANSVPFYLFIPRQYQDKLDIRFDPNRIGSHKDIFPTLYSVTLSDVQYPDFGRNLLSESSDSLHDFGFNVKVITTAKGVIAPTPDGLSSHQEQLDKITFYPWVHNDDLIVASGRRLNEDEIRTVKRIVAYKKLLRWQIAWQANKESSSKD